MPQKTIAVGVACADVPSDIVVGWAVPSAPALRGSDPLAMGVERTTAAAALTAVINAVRHWETMKSPKVG